MKLNGRHGYICIDALHNNVAFLTLKKAIEMTLFCRFLGMKRAAKLFRLKTVIYNFPYH